MSGRMKYRKEKEAAGFLLEEINQNWKKLPHESKKYWEVIGRGTRTRARIGSHQKLKKVMKSGSQVE